MNTAFAAFIKFEGREAAAIVLAASLVPGFIYFIYLHFRWMGHLLDNSSIRPVVRALYLNFTEEGGDHFACIATFDHWHWHPLDRMRRRWCSQWACPLTGTSCTLPLGKLQSIPCCPQPPSRLPCRSTKRSMLLLFNIFHIYIHYTIS